MKRYLIPIALLAFAALIISPLGQTMRTVNDTNEMVLLNPRTINSNLFVHVMPPLKGSVWTFIAGDTTGPDTNHLDSVLYPGLGRWVWNNIGTNYFETLIVSNLVAGGDSLWTNLGGILQPQNLTLPVMLTNQLQFGPGTTNVLHRDAVTGTDLVYTNGAADVKFKVFNDTGAGVALEAQGAAGIVSAVNPTTSVALRAGARQVTLDSVIPGFRPVVDLSEDSGAMKFAWKSNIVQHSIIRGFESGVGSPNASYTVISQTDTNSPLVINQITTGTAGYSRGFDFQTNGVSLFTITGTGGPSSAANWIANGTTGSDLRNGVNPMKATVYNTYANAGTDYERGVLDWITTPNSFTVGTENGGTGQSRNVQFRQGGTNICYIDAATGGLEWNADGTRDIGSNGVNRPRSIYLSDNVTCNIVYPATMIQIGSGPAVRIYPGPNDGILRVTKSTGGVNYGGIEAAQIQAGITRLLTNSTASDFLYISVPNTNGIGGHVVYTVFGTDGTDVQEISGDVKFAAVAKGTTVTATLADVQSPAALTGGSTLTAVLAANTTTNNVFALGITATTSLTTTNLLIKWRLETPSTYTVNSL